MNQVNNNATVEETVTDDPRHISLADNKGVSNVEENEEKVSHILQKMKITMQRMMKSLKDRIGSPNFWDKDGPDLEKSLRVIIRGNPSPKVNTKHRKMASTKRSSLKKKV